ncbi:MAG: aromatic aminobenezylarsenical efflux permease ArsG family transporter [Candidatus Omnitrophica bacterium]|nr:aromatic aminobenezylarsenical efflux permease ArsG family transporter [Candidatus Omnitrophota bacterium]
MTEILISSVSALWLGILASISPCPLVSNVAAVSFLSKKIVHPALVLISGIAYTLGRMVSYAVLGWVIINSFLSVPQVAQFLQKYIGKVLGPLLIITGLILLRVIILRLPNISLSEKHQNRLGESSAAGAFLLGFIFALAFCPISAALFFGSIIPLALNSKTGALLPFIYGVGTGLPVLIFAVAIAFGVTSFKQWFGRIAEIECYARCLTGAIFIVIGVYYVWVHIISISKI